MHLCKICLSTKQVLRYILHAYPFFFLFHKPQNANVEKRHESQWKKINDNACYFPAELCDANRT
ncbi:CLUMA_CG016111, isoform A [Clunio marinus]|uniref:CLUMA_CG016111, isoform A n=1 Tax=Clunio marinus TaxID=568069 RepID=A0A1J1IRC6_9DIPT|nr:CLUMA_CG016111, isoform A [Clunio marinus]